MGLCFQNNRSIKRNHNYWVKSLTGSIQVATEACLEAVSGPWPAHLAKGLCEHTAAPLACSGFLSDRCTSAHTQKPNNPCLKSIVTLFKTPTAALHFSHTHIHYYTNLCHNAVRSQDAKNSVVCNWHYIWVCNPPLQTDCSAWRVKEMLVHLSSPVQLQILSWLFTFHSQLFTLKAKFLCKLSYYHLSQDLQIQWFQGIVLHFAWW